MKAIVAAGLLLPALALGQTTVAVPQTIGYQGRLLKADGSPETGAVQITFTVYDAETGGTLMWSEPQTVALTNGFYAVFLGSVKPFSNATTVPLFDGGARWLELQIQGDTTPLAPRQRIASVAYAMTATNAAHAVAADSATNVSGGGTVNATSVTATGNVTATGVVSAGSVSASGDVTTSGGRIQVGVYTVAVTSPSPPPPSCTVTSLRTECNCDPGDIAIAGGGSAAAPNTCGVALRESSRIDPRGWRVVCVAEGTAAITGCNGIWTPSPCSSGHVVCLRHGS